MRAALVPLLAVVLDCALAACGSRTAVESLEPARDGGTRDVDAEAEAQPLCGPGSCAGCCDDAGACHPGDAAALCGEQGRACVSCDPAQDEICEPQPGFPDERVCWAPCDPRTCTGGCCSATGQCVVASSDATCGNVGTLCVDCTATDQVCRLRGGRAECVNQ